MTKNIDSTNDHSAALACIKATPVGQAGQFHAIAFFREDRRRISVIQEGAIARYGNDEGASELVRLNLRMS